MSDLYRVDLLRERREELGLKAPVYVDSALLLRQGVLLASIPVAISILLLGFVGVRLFSVARSADALSADHARYEQLSSRVQNRRVAVKKIKASNEELVDQILMLPVSSALLSEFASLTPSGVQLLSIQEKDRSLVIKGSSVEPLAFARIESLLISLANSSLFEPQSIQLVKADLGKQESKASATSQAQTQSGTSNQALVSQGKIPLGGGQVRPDPSSPLRSPVPQSQSLGFELKASLTESSAKDLVQDLVALGAKGLAIRARELERLGFLK